MLKESGSLGLLFVDATWLSRIEQAYGRKVYGQVLDSLTDLLLGMCHSEIRAQDLISVNGVAGEQFLIFLSSKREDRGFSPGDLEGLSNRISTYLNQNLRDIVRPFVNTRPKITVGYAITLFNPLVQEERQVYKLVDDAKELSGYQKFREGMRNKEKIQELIVKEAIRIFFQPIVFLNNYKLLGYEGLCRGPMGTEYESPLSLFEMAHEAELGFELDRICRKKALHDGVNIDSSQLLFINCLATAVHDPEFTGVPLKNLLDKLGLSPSRIVMEISEQEAIRNFNLFGRAIDNYKELGFSIAIDDIGAGYSSLESVVELQPDFFKLDISLIHGIGQNKVKRELIKAIMRLAESMEAEIIAEGIETESELNALIDIGVPLGQGFYIGYPDAVPVKPIRK